MANPVILADGIVEYRPDKTVDLKNDIAGPGAFRSKELVTIVEPGGFNNISYSLIYCSNKQSLYYYYYSVRFRHRRKHVYISAMLKIITDNNCICNLSRTIPNEGTGPVID